MAASNTPVRKAGVSPEIRNKHLSYKNLKNCFQISLLAKA
jgi:hypothetical protein